CGNLDGCYIRRKVDLECARRGISGFNNDLITEYLNPGRCRNRIPANHNFIRIKNIRSVWRNDIWSVRNIVRKCCGARKFLALNRCTDELVIPLREQGEQFRERKLIEPGLF